MRVDELGLPDSITEALNSEGYFELHPPQAEAVPLALKGRNLVTAIPTASGKSLIGYIPALKTVCVDGKKVLYIVPLKALASEKKDDFDKFSSLGIKTHLSSGDLDTEDRGIKDANVVIATSEKVDSMIRHGSEWLSGIGLTIADEIHIIHDPNRGPTLEVALTKLKRRNRDMQIIALSATISNSVDLSLWLEAELVRSDWRPIPLKEGVYFDKKITFGDGSEREV
ncbi:MAG: DEAD/DEAH box helicase, partial [Candidatus Methanomethylophilaceae archaeon]|nr:DEAD/DEAH box helicase [Candidatus Methanomethylophilaceae archaeon]